MKNFIGLNQRGISWPDDYIEFFPINKRYTPRLLLIKPLMENVKMKLKFNPHLSLNNLNNHPTLNEKSHMKTQLSLPNIHDQKTLLIQSLMNNF